MHHLWVYRLNGHMTSLSSLQLHLSMNFVNHSFLLLLLQSVLLLDLLDLLLDELMLVHHVASRLSETVYISIVILFSLVDLLHVQFEDF